MLKTSANRIKTKKHKSHIHEMYNYIQPKPSKKVNAGSIYLKNRVIIIIQFTALNKSTSGYYYCHRHRFQWKQQGDIPIARCHDRFCPYTTFFFCGQ